MQLYRKPSLLIHSYDLISSSEEIIGNPIVYKGHSTLLAQEIKNSIAFPNYAQACPFDGGHNLATGISPFNTNANELSTSTQSSFLLTNQLQSGFDNKEEGEHHIFLDFFKII